MGNKYKKPFLKSVIFRIDLAQPLSQSQKLASDFHEIIKSKFPIIEPISGIQFEATMGMEKDKAPSVKQTQHIVRSNRFSDADRKTILMVEPGPPNLNLLFNSYDNSDELNRLVGLITATVSQVYGNVLIKRTGLRYINNINLNGGNVFDWALFVNGHLISMLDFLPDKGTMSRALGRIELNKDTHKIQFYYGIANPEYPNPIARKEFILDYDCYSTEEINITEVSNTVKILHEEIKTLFENSILDGLREKMVVISDE
jgi:uncharacterized protein (TIGR04255 family)